MDFAHSNSEPGVFPPMNHINVRFVSLSPIHLQIKKSSPMKTSTPTRNETAVPSLFQMAAHLEDSVPAARLRKTVPAPSQTPFVDLVLRPEKLEAALKDARAENEAFDASLTTGRNGAKRATSNSPPNSVTIKKNGANPPREFKNVEFFLKAPCGQIGQARRRFYGLGKMSARLDAERGWGLVQLHPAGAGTIFLPFHRGRSMVRRPAFRPARSQSLWHRECRDGGPLSGKHEPVSKFRPVAKMPAVQFPGSRKRCDRRDGGVFDSRLDIDVAAFAPGRLFERFVSRAASPKMKG